MPLENQAVNRPQNRGKSRVVEKMDLADGQVIGSLPPSVDPMKHFRRERFVLHGLRFPGRGEVDDALESFRRSC